MSIGVGLAEPFVLKIVFEAGGLSDVAGNIEAIAPDGDLPAVAAVLGLVDPLQQVQDDEF